MFIYILYKSPLWNKLPTKNRIIKIFGIGILLYFIIQSLLYSKYFNNNTLTNYRKYIYYIIILDIITTITTMTISFNTEKKYIDYNPHYQQNMPYRRVAEQNSYMPRNVPLDVTLHSASSDIPNSQIEWQNMQKYNDQYDNIKLNDIETQLNIEKQNSCEKLLEIGMSQEFFDISEFPKIKTKLMSKIQPNIDENGSSHDIPVYKSDIKKKSNIDDVSYDIPSYKPNN